MRIRNISSLLLSVILLLGGCLAVSCDKLEQPYDKGDHVFLYYVAGHNSLSTWLTDDIKELEENYLPSKRRRNNVVLMFCRLKDYKNYPGGSPSHLVRLYRKHDGKTGLDTLLTLKPHVNAADPKTVRLILNFIRKKYPGRKYGMLFSSHASGWLPKGYYGYESDFEGTDVWKSGMQKSIGQDAVGKESYEIDLKAFANYIPMKLEYLLFDCCLMGGIECAWELREKADQIAFSQTEILADGFDYKKILTSLLQQPDYGPLQICQDYFDQYKVKTGWEQSATISLIRTRNLETLAQLCRELTGKYSLEISELDRSSVQRYFRYNFDYFFDLKDIFQQAGADETELAQLQEALDQCVIYKAATDEFMLEHGGFKVRNYSGLSMYLPDSQKHYLNDYYKTLKWNLATGLVK